MKDIQNYSKSKSICNRNTGYGPTRDGNEKELWQTVARGLKAAVELGKLDEDEAKEIWQEMTEGDEDEDEEDR